MKRAPDTPLRVLVLSRSYPNPVQQQYGLWAERLVRQHSFRRRAEELAALANGWIQARTAA